MESFGRPSLRDRLAPFAAMLQRVYSSEHARESAALKEQMRKLRTLAEPVREGKLDLTRSLGRPARD